MKLQTHVAFGLFFGMFFYYFLGFDIGFALLTGFAAFIPDIDYIIQRKWHKDVHRKHLHNIWAMFGFAFVSFLVFNNLLLVLAIIVGFLSHLIADSFTVMGIHWLYPFKMDDDRYWTKGSINMTDYTKDNRIEKMIRNILFTLSGLLFFIREVTIDIFSSEGAITFFALAIVGFVLFNQFDKFIVKAIRNLGL